MPFFHGIPITGDNQLSDGFPRVGDLSVGWIFQAEMMGSGKKSGLRIL